MEESIEKMYLDQIKKRLEKSLIKFIPKYKGKNKLIIWLCEVFKIGEYKIQEFKNGSIVKVTRPRVFKHSGYCEDAETLLKDYGVILPDIKKPLWWLKDAKE